MLQGVSGRSVTLAVETPPSLRFSVSDADAEPDIQRSPDGIRIPAKTPAFEFCIIAGTADSNLRIRLPEDWKANTYRDGTGSETNVGRSIPGLRAVPRPANQGRFSDAARDGSRGTGKEGLLSDDAQHILTSTGSLACAGSASRRRTERSENAWS